MTANSITVVFTSCNRPDLLFKTLNSFFLHADYPISKVIVVEDGIQPLAFLHTYPFRVPVQIISTGEWVGQIAAIDYAYSLVETEYIFHVEDDWEFYRSGFLRRSLELLKHEPECLQVWLRAEDDTNKHPLEGERRYLELIDSDVVWRKLEYDYCDDWHGFSFNPGLRRMSDYVEAKGYGIHFINYGAKLEKKESGEVAMSHYYRRQNKFAAILIDNAGTGYVRHIGWDRTVPYISPVELS